MPTRFVDTLNQIEQAISRQTIVLGKMDDTLTSLETKLFPAGTMISGTAGDRVFGLLSSAFGTGTQITERISAAARGTATAPSPFGGIGNLAGGVGDIAALFGPYGMAAGAVLKLGGAALKSVDSLMDWSRSMMESQFQFAKISPSMQMIKLQQDFEDKLFNLKMGERLAESTLDLSNAFNTLRDDTTDFQVRWKQFWNQQATDFLKAADILAERMGLTGEMDEEDKAYWNLPRKERYYRGTAFERKFEKLTKIGAAPEDWAKDYGLPQRMRGGPR